MDGTILVADDDRTIRTVLTQALTRAGCKVHATSSLVTLMRWVEEGKGDLVISDVIMPDGNGLEQLPKINAIRPGLPVIVISAQNTIMTAIQATEAEAYDYLPKPFDLPDLMKRAGRALDVKRRAPAPVSRGSASRRRKAQKLASKPQTEYPPMARRGGTVHAGAAHGETGCGGLRTPRATTSRPDSLPAMAINASFSPEFFWAAVMRSRYFLLSRNFSGSPGSRVVAISCCSPGSRKCSSRVRAPIGIWLEHFGHTARLRSSSGR